MISTKIHGYMDYLMAALLILLPFLFVFPNGSPSSVPIILGIGTIIYSSMTKYEMGPFKLIPMKIHLGIDFISGVLLIASPWLFGFAEEAAVWPFVVLGIVEIGASLMTEKYAPPIETEPID